MAEAKLKITEYKGEGCIEFRFYNDPAWWAHDNLAKVRNEEIHYHTIMLDNLPASDGPTVIVAVRSHSKAHPVDITVMQLRKIIDLLLKEH